jgi:hypothetical protein
MPSFLLVSRYNKILAKYIICDIYLCKLFAKLDLLTCKTAKNYT